MKGKRVLLILVFAAVLTVGWITVVKAVTGSEIIKKQNELVAEADNYFARKLYVRAIPLYEEALTYSTEQNEIIQKKLLEAYLEYGDLSAYIKLVEKRITAGSAMEEEYLNVADYYIGRSKMEEGLAIVKTGMAQLETEALETYFEEKRYAYSVRNTKYVDILPTSSNTMMPAFDGEKWGYVDQTGKVRLQFIYDMALPFNNYGYAVVSLDGTYYTILKNGDRYGADDGSNYPEMTDVVGISGTHILGKRDGAYSYYNYDFQPVAPGHQYNQITANACGVAAVKKDDRWGIITDSGAVVVDFILDDVAVNSLGCAFAGNRAMVKENGKWHLIDVEGNSLGDGEYENAKAPESSGYIAVANGEDKWGYINSEGKLVIDYQYKDALSFSNGLGAVKIVDNWGYISTGNNLVIEDFWDSVSPFHEGIAQVGFTDRISLITLEYYEK